MSGSLLSAWADLRYQWQVNTRLRAGVWVIVGILWIYGLLLVGDAVVNAQKASAMLVAEIDRLRPLTRANPWPARVDEARERLTVLGGMGWAEGDTGDLGLTEAAFQDWTRSTATKAGLRLREISLTRAGPASGEGSGAAGPSVAARPGTGQTVKLRLTADWGRTEMVSFLAELGRSERVIVVDRLMLRLSATPPLVEIDLRVWAGASAVKPEQAAASRPGAGKP